MHPIGLVAAILLSSLSLAAPPQVPPAPPFEPLPVIEWGKPLAGGPLDLVCLLQGAKEDGLELLRRFDFRGELLVSGSGKYGVKSTASSLARRRLKTGDVDVFVIGGVYWKSLPATLRLALLENVEKGMGLLLVDSAPNWWDTTLPKVMAASPAPDAVAAVTAGIPIDLLPLHTITPERNAYCVYPDADHPAPTPEQLVTAARFGKGRICILNYSVAQSNVVYLYSLTPGVRLPNAPFAREYPYWEYCHSLLGKAVRWCAGREPEVRLEAVAEPVGPTVATVRVAGAGPVVLTAEVRDHTHELLGRVETRLDLVTDRPATWQVTLPAAQLPPEGLYFVNVWARRDGRTLDWTTAAGHMPSPAKVTGVNLDRMRYARNEPVRVVIKHSGNPAQSLRATLTGTDGRILQSQTLKATPDATLEFSLRSAQTLVSYLDVRLLAGARTLSRERVQVLLAPGAPEEFFAYSWMDAEAYYTRDYLRRIKDQGVDAVLAGGGAATYYFQGGRMATEENLRLVPTNVVDSRLGQPPDGDPAKLPRPLTAPKIIAEETSRLRTNIPVVAAMQPLGYSLMDEWALGGDGRPTDYSEPSLQAFRRWLPKLYPTVEAVNASWGSAFASWDAVVPVQLKDLPKVEGVPDWSQLNLAPFVDYRLFMDTVGPTAFAGFAETIRKLDPGARVGLCGTESNGTWYGHEWYQFCQALDFICGYGDAAAEPIISRGMRGLQRELQRSFRRPGTLLSCWVGYHNTDFYRDQALKLLLHDFHGIAYFGGNPEIFADFPYLNYDFALSDRALLAGACTDEIRRGLDQLIWNSRRDDCGLAILISQPSLHVASAMGQEGLWGEAVVAMARAVEDAGYQYDFVAPQQLAAGVLAEKGYRVLLAPQVSCLSGAEIDALQRFTASGGKLLHDRLPGVLDEHGKARPEAPEWPAPRALALGEGPQDRAQARALLAGQLAACGLQPLAQITQAEGEPVPTEMVRYQNGDHDLISVQTEWLANAQPDPDATMRLPQEGFVYDVREGKALGKMSEVKAKLDRNHILLYAILPYAVQAVQVKPQSATVAAGAEITVDISVQAKGKLGAHVLRLTVKGPDGKPLPGFARTISASSGRSRTTLGLALNDPQGLWELSVRDVETGVVGTAALRVR